MAHKKAGGSSRNGRDSPAVARREAVRRQELVAGNIIVRQRGTHVHPGRNVGLGKDHTLYATSHGVVRLPRRQLGRAVRQRRAAAEAIAAE